MTITVEPVDGPDDSRFGGVLAVWRAIDAELDPHDPPIPHQELGGELFAPPPDHRQHVWLATVGGEPAGVAVSVQELDGVNDAVIRLEVRTAPEHRRRGLARALVRSALPVVVGDGGTSLLGTSPTEPGSVLCRSLGLTHRLDERYSRLRVAEVDPVQQQLWIDDGPRRAPGYELVGWVGIVPEAWGETLARGLDAMVDEPVDDLEWHPQPVTATQVRQREESWDRMGCDTVTTLALAPDGSPAGATQILASRLRPPLGWQADTGVVAKHRGHRLGRWLKAVNLRRALAHQPALEVVQTANAESNPYMLAINVDMGYRPHRSYAAYQGPIEAVLAALS
ncbi:MAG: GNAT family N-acetyltransferase [Acidimicrobiales bacterium]